MFRLTRESGYLIDVEEGVYLDIGPVAYSSETDPTIHAGEKTHHAVKIELAYDGPSHAISPERCVNVVWVTTHRSWSHNP